MDITSIDIILSKKRTTKVLIRLRGCAGWSAPLLFAYGINHIFSWPGSLLLNSSEKLIDGRSVVWFCSSLMELRWFLPLSCPFVELPLSPNTGRYMIGIKCNRWAVERLFTLLSLFYFIFIPYFGPEYVIITIVIFAFEPISQKPLARLVL